MFPALSRFPKSWLHSPPMQTAFAIGKNLKTGEVFAEEYGRHAQVKGQLSMEDEVEIPVDPETGEVIEPQKAVVLDLRNTMAN